MQASCCRRFLVPKGNAKPAVRSSSSSIISSSSDNSDHSLSSSLTSSSKSSSAPSVLQTRVYKYESDTSTDDETSTVSSSSSDSSTSISSTITSSSSSIVQTPSFDIVRIEDMNPNQALECLLKMKIPFNSELLKEYTMKINVQLVECSINPGLASIAEKKVDKLRKAFYCVKIAEKATRADFRAHPLEALRAITMAENVLGHSKESKKMKKVIFENSHFAMTIPKFFRNASQYFAVNDICVESWFELTDEEKENLVKHLLRCGCDVIDMDEAISLENCEWAEIEAIDERLRAKGLKKQNEILEERVEQLENNQNVVRCKVDGEWMRMHILKCRLCRRGIVPSCFMNQKWRKEHIGKCGFCRY